MLENCAICHQPFTLEANARVMQNADDYCNECAEDYYKAYSKILSFIASNERPTGYQLQDLHYIVSGAEVDQVFVQRFFENAQFTKGAMPPPDRNCERCHQELIEGERRYCKNCAVDVSDAVQTIHLNLQQERQVTYLKKKSRTSGRSRRYGLSREKET